MVLHLLTPGQAVASSRVNPGDDFATNDRFELEM